MEKRYLGEEETSDLSDHVRMFVLIWVTLLFPVGGMNLMLHDANMISFKLSSSSI